MYPPGTAVNRPVSAAATAAAFDPDAHEHVPLAREGPGRLPAPPRFGIDLLQVHQVPPVSERDRAPFGRTRRDRHDGVRERQVAVDRELRHVGKADLNDGEAEDEDDGEEEEKAVGNEEPQEPPHEAAVERLAEDLVVVERLAH